MHRNKNDANDADGITEASSRPGMRFVGLKSVDQQQIQQLHRARRLAVRERTAHANQLHGFLLEYGIESPKGVGALRRRLADVLEDAENELPFAGRALLFDLGGELRRLDERVRAFDARVAAIAQVEPACRRLEAIPGIGPLTSTALVASVGDAKAFKNGRELAAWLGLTPRQHSTGGRPKLLGISKRGDRYLRCLLIHGARGASPGGTPRGPAQPLGDPGRTPSREKCRRGGVGEQERAGGLGGSGQGRRFRSRASGQGGMRNACAGNAGGRHGRKGTSDHDRPGGTRDSFAGGDGRRRLRGVKLT